MFNMKEIGGTISRMRKAANLTQMELADRMGVSFQAVSNWERGQTMPDISRLPELSSALGVTVDEILGDKKAARLVETLEKGETPLKLTAPELREVAPLLLPAQADRVAREAGLSMAELVAMAPFVSEEVLGELARDFAESEGTLGELAAIAPFLEGDALGEIAERLLERGGKVSEIAALAPFLDGQVVSRMAAAAIRAEGIAAAMPLMPFVDSGALDELLRGQKGFFGKRPR